MRNTRLPGACRTRGFKASGGFVELYVYSGGSILVQPFFEVARGHFGIFPTKTVAPQVIHRAPNSVVVTGGTSAASTPVGPIPGSPQLAHYLPSPLASDPVALQDGRRLFDWYNCSGCHGGHAGGGMGPSLRDEVWIYGSRDDQIYSTIVQGRANGMPAWGSKIPQEQIWELVAYIKSMRTPQERDPPVEPADEMVPDPPHQQDHNRVSLEVMGIARQ